VQILLTNDDGIYAPGLDAMRRALEPLGDVGIMARRSSRAGGHSIVSQSAHGQKVFDGERRALAIEAAADA
jgi:5'-nucleotidase